MKEKIENFSKGEFLYELPYLELSERQLSIYVEAGRIYKGNFTIGNSFHCKMKGVVYSSNQFFSVEQTTFSGIENTIHYSFHATYLNAGEIIDGTITIVSDCGEKEILFHVVVEPQSMKTSIGKINDLFQFAGLAKIDWSEAKEVFKHQDFKGIFLKENEQLCMLYDGLRKGSHTSQQLEEFLVAIHKKLPINISVDKSKLSYNLENETYQDNLTIMKSGWGHLKIEVTTDAKFIKLEQKTIWSDHFLGNSYSLSFLIDPAVFTKGNSFGNIYLKTLYQTIQIPVVCHKLHSSTNENQKKITKLQAELVENYILFQTNNKKTSYFMMDEKNILDTLMLHDPKSIYKLLGIGLDIMGGKNTKARKQMEAFVVDPKDLEDEFFSGVYRYLNAWIEKDYTQILKVKESIALELELAPYDWRLLWLVLYMQADANYDYKKRLGQIKQSFWHGCHSPLLYNEAFKFYQQDPSSIKELGDFELQIMNFGAKYGCFTKEVAIQFAYLVSKEKKYSSFLYRILVKVYETFPEKEVLGAICGLLIKGNKTKSSYFTWYKKAVDEQIRITQIYEYYMYSFDENSKEKISQSVLLYFSYHSQLSIQKKAFLYAYILSHKDELGPLVRAYMDQIQEFTLSMLKAGNINRNLAVVYENMILEDMIEEEPYCNFPLLSFSKELCVKRDFIKGVYVYHKEFEKPEYYPIENSKAYPSLYSENTMLIFVDDEGNRFADTIDYTMHSIFKPGLFTKNLVEKNLLNKQLMIQQMEKVLEYQVFNEASIQFRQQVLEMDGLRKRYENDIYLSLLEYYYDNNMLVPLEQLLGLRTKFKISVHKLGRVTELLIICDMFEAALELLLEVPYENMPTRSLVRLCSKYISKGNLITEHVTLLSVCHYVFLKGKYDEAILTYLNRFYYGTTKELHQLWKASKEFDIDTHVLEERLLSQMLFSESYVKDSFAVFDSYYHNINQNALVKAFLSYFGFKYLHNDRMIRSELYDIMKRELNYEDNDIYRLSLLKYYSTRDRLNQIEKLTVELYLKQMLEKNIVLPFFTKLSKYISLPAQLCDRYYVEYHANPSKKVYIHYRIEQDHVEAGFIREQMKNQCLGIFVKDFILFYGETIQYYITEESDGNEIITESYNIRVENDTDELEEGDYPQLNLMLMSREMKDDTGLLELIEQYGEKRYLYEQCFKPI